MQNENFGQNILGDDGENIIKNQTGNNSQTTCINVINIFYIKGSEGVKCNRR